MLLLLCSTEDEYAELIAAGFAATERVICRVCGVGPVETTLYLSSLLARDLQGIDQVLLFGVGGAYCGSGAGLLDLCLAEHEVLGDLGICQGEGTVPFEAVSFAPPQAFSLASDLLARCQKILAQQNIPCCTGPFVTVSSASSTRSRGDFFRRRYQAICENMEGAAAARVCQAAALPFVEIRAISNLVEDRDLSTWRVREAAGKAARTAFLLTRHLF